MNDTATLFQGAVRAFPTYGEMTRMRSRGQAIRFTLIRPDDIEEEVEILEHATRAMHPQDGHVWWGIVCPVSGLENKDGARAIRVICESDNGFGTYL